MRATNASVRGELALVLLVAWVALIAIPLGVSPLALSWDALNHHIYLGWMADRGRFDNDFVAAGYQAYQFPYLYWPVYKLAMAGVGPRVAGAVLATLQLVVVPAIWMVARACIPGPGLREAAMRVLAVLLAFLSAVVLSMVDSSSNDFLAAAPLVWAAALALEASLRDHADSRTRWLLAASGFMAGAAIAFKLSNGPLVVLLPLLWFASPGSWRERLTQTTLAGVMTIAGLSIVYGYWGVQLWTHFGNPVYPFYDDAFEGLRRWAGWAG